MNVKKPGAADGSMLLPLAASLVLLVLGHYPLQLTRKLGVMYQTFPFLQFSVSYDEEGRQSSSKVGGQAGVLLAACV
jgi:hypothetical protein